MYRHVLPSSGFIYSTYVSLVLSIHGLRRIKYFDKTGLKCVLYIFNSSPADLFVSIFHSSGAVKLKMMKNAYIL